MDQLRHGLTLLPLSISHGPKPHDVTPFVVLLRLNLFSLKSDLLYEYNDISTFKSTTKNEGYLFYGGIMRARIPHVPVCINISKKYIKIENKIKADRDRNSFSSALTNTFLSIWARSGFYYNGMKNNKAIKSLYKTAGLEPADLG